MRNTQCGSYTIKIVVECPDQLNEVLPDDLETLALAIEERISLALIELFRAIAVTTVTVTYCPPTPPT